MGMKGLQQFLKVFLWVQLGSCVGRVLQRYLDYTAHPERYAFDSAPWYTGMALTAALTAVGVALTAMAYFIVGHVIQKREQADGGISDKENSCG